MRFIQITDTHLLDHAGGLLYGVNTTQSLQAVVEHIHAHEQNIAGILTTGDLTHDGGAPAYQRLLQLLAPLNAPVYCLPGNHDALDIFSSTLNGPDVQSGGRLLTDTWQLVFLDSAVAGAVLGHLGEAELERLETALREYPEHHTLLCLHHHPVPVGSAWLDAHSLNNPEALFAITDRHPQLRGIIWGHVHQCFEATRQDIRLLACPSSCIQFKPDCVDFTLDDKPPGYRWLGLRADGGIETGVVFVPMN